MLALAEGVQVAIVGAVGMISTAAIGAYVTIATARTRTAGAQTNAVLDQATTKAIDQKAELAAMKAELASLREQLGRPSSGPGAAAAGPDDASTIPAPGVGDTAQ